MTSSERRVNSASSGCEMRRRRRSQTLHKPQLRTQRHMRVAMSADRRTVA